MKIIAAKFVLPISSDPITDGAVAIENGRIAAVGTKSEMVARYADAAIEDHGDAVVMPGLVNAHAHLELTAMRGMLEEHDHDFPRARAAVSRHSATSDGWGASDWKR